ncbi:type I phosphomannose isomerase catalytic subunit [Sandaracinus amylolyticus]|uniref:type I phosphomannose isomerase catalytic subunit n=1 Tax=Sandaracinus amylolyticus TaxID=927083 RepID=UPI001F1AE12B|nr:type I phosphomannose isomerase catalytic subunit [Sandaracinus amylolyticus]UJR81600.1 Phosphomannose isomerase [Sandaracinus amylolyticus]
MIPLLLAEGNVTSPARTPWGGHRIARVLKHGRIDEHVRIGESWELSAGPELPSRLDTDARTLADVLGAAPALLGREASRGGTALLVKVLDAAEPLSVQIHPSDDYARLAEGESGKPESWYVEHAEEGAGIFLGLAPHATRDAVARAIAEGEDLSALLSFVPVSEGDFVLVQAGTPHAIGAGVTLVEPQRVLPGRRGVTYRYWDWNRRYDADGRVDPKGAPRALHVDDALAVTDWSAPRGDAFLARARRRAGAPELAGAPRLEALAGARDAALTSDALEVWRVSGTGALVLPPHDALRSITVLAGRVEIGDLEIVQGRTAALPATRDAQPITLDRACAILASAL